MILVPAASGVGAVLLAVTHQDRPLMAAAGLLVLAASIAVGLAMVIGSRTGVRRRTRQQRERYLDYLEQARTAARDGADLQRGLAAIAHPDPQAAAGLARRDTRRWERRPDDADFMLLRIGIGVVPLATPVTLQVDANDPLVEYDPVCLAAAQELASRHAVLAAQPICLPLRNGAVVSVVGSAERSRGVVRAMLAQLIWAHSPTEVAVLVYSRDRSGAWEWLKWLPHSHSGHDRDGPLPVRLITDSAAQALHLLTGEVADGPMTELGPARRVVLIIDQLADDAMSEVEVTALGTAASALRVPQVHLVRNQHAEPDRVDIRVLVGQSDARVTGAGPVPAPAPAPAPVADLVQFAAAPGFRCSLDHLDASGALQLARSFAPLQARSRDVGPVGIDPRRVDPLRWGDVATLDPRVSWRPRAGGDLLRVPIGSAPDGGAISLDLKESAQGGMGPHGLVVGATGSGKSELLRTLVTALAINHPPDTLALLLADFKGGATFSGLASLPHVAGMITNLEADLSLVDRFRDALGGEVQRRQEVLAAAGKLTSLVAYLELRRRQPERDPMPHLLVIVDEFSELLGARPDLADLFVTIGRIGRSIGIHLLLATQRLDTGRIRGLESHLSYRICLRTFSESESREAIGGPDAHHLPAEPGWGYLRGDGPELRLFRAATVSRPYRSPQLHHVYSGTPILPFSAHNGLAARVAALHENSTSHFAADHAPAIDQDPYGHRRRSILEVAANRLTTLAPLHQLGRRARPVWLDPLPGRLTLADLLSRSISGSSSPDGVSAVLGLIDDPPRQRQELLTWDFADGGGNLLIVGAGRSGKSTALRALLVSLAVRHSPGEVEVICVDFGGETLLPLGELPHVAAVTTRSDPELTRRVFDRLRGLLTEREALFRRHRFESPAAFRQARKAGGIDASIAGDVVVLIDGWAGVGESDGVPDGALDEILRRGAGVGIHTVLTVASPSQLRARLVGQFGGRIELRLSDSFDSVIDRHMAKALPVDLPGRALVAGRRYAQITVPELRTNVADSDRAHQPTVGRATSGGDCGSDEQADPLGVGHRAFDGTAVGPGVSVPVPGPAVDQHSADHIVAAVRARWPGQSVARIRKLPELVTLADLLMVAADRDLGLSGPAGLLLGLAEGEVGAVPHDLLGEDPHLLVFGDAKSGKTAALRNVLTQLMGRPDPTAARGANELAVVDYRRSLSLNGSAELTIATNSARAGMVCAAIANELARRLNEPAERDPSLVPGRDVDPRGDLVTGCDRGTSRSPGTGSSPGTGGTGGDRGAGDAAVRGRAEIYLLVDDYNLVANVAGNPLHPLLPYLPHARDLGFHLILARHTGGAARAQYEPLLQVLGDLGTPMLLLSGSPAEGRLAHGLVPQILPPGRARVATRGSVPQLIQTAWVP